MPSDIKISSIQAEHPVHYPYPPLARWFMIVFASTVCMYSLYFMIRFVNSTTPMVFKILPLIIIFVAFNSVLRHLTSLNCVSFYEDRIRFSYILKRNVEIIYTEITYMELRKQITYYLQLRYRSSSGVEKLFTTPASYPKTLEIMLVISNLSPNIQLSEKLSQAMQYMRTKAQTDEQQV